MKILSIAFLILSFFKVQSQIEDRDSIFYRQKVKRDDKLFVVGMFKPRAGMIFLTKDSLLFRSKRPQNSILNFSIPYTQIISINKFYGFLIPNRIQIRTKNGGSYRLFTYRKKEILEITRARVREAQKH